MALITTKETVTVAAPLADVLAAVRDTARQPEWFPGMVSATVVTSDDQGRTTRAHQVNDLKIAKDEFDLDFVHSDSGVTWSLVAPSKAQRVSEGSWALVDRGGSTEVTLSLAVDSSLPLPGFLLKKALGDNTKGAVKGLKAYVEAGGR